MPTKPAAVPPPKTPKQVSKSAMAPGIQVADIKARAARMRGQGVISKASHDKLVAKADKVAKAAAAKGLDKA